MSKETFCSIFKLVEACNQGSQVFLGGAANVAEPALQDLALRIGRKLVQFESELQPEIRRVGVGDPAALRSELPPMDRNSLLVCGKISLALILFYYQQALKTTLADVVCAKVKRQYSEMQQAYEQLASLHRAA